MIKSVFCLLVIIFASSFIGGCQNKVEERQYNDSEKNTTRNSEVQSMVTHYESNQESKETEKPALKTVQNVESTDKEVESDISKTKSSCDGILEVMKEYVTTEDPKLFQTLVTALYANPQEFISILTQLEQRGPIFLLVAEEIYYSHIGEDDTLITALKEIVPTEEEEIVLTYICNNIKGVFQHESYLLKLFETYTYTVDAQDAAKEIMEYLVWDTKLFIDILSMIDYKEQILILIGSEVYMANMNSNNIYMEAINAISPNELYGPDDINTLTLIKQCINGAYDHVGKTGPF